jgi:CheY-like chemotaxis protein
MNKERTVRGDYDNPLCRGLNVLLVDDDEICLFIHQRVLEQSGLCRRTYSAGNGRRALELLDQAQMGTLPYPDIIFLDLQMPVMDGIAFLEAFRKLDSGQKQNVPVVLLTSSVSESDRAIVASLGVRHCLAKPFTDEAFKAVLGMLYDWPDSTGRGA